jgi:hypothetical protein
MTSRAVLMTLFLLVPGLSVSQGTTSPIDGVWRVTELVTTGAKPSTNSSPQPSLIIFARGHYSWMSFTGTIPRKQAAPAAAQGQLTDADKIARYEEWAPLTANSGTFEVSGTTITRRLLVAKNVNAMSATTPTVQQFTFKVEGQTLVLSGPAPGNPDIQQRFTLTRVR